MSLNCPPLEGKGRKSRTLDAIEQCAALGDVIYRGFSGEALKYIAERDRIEAQLRSQLHQHGFVIDTAVLDVVCPLDSLQDGHAFGSGSQDGGDGRFGIEHDTVLPQESLAVILSIGLAAQFGDAHVVLQNELAQGWSHRLTIGTRHHAPSVKLDVPAITLSGGLEERR